MTEILEVKNLNISFKIDDYEFQALHNINFSVKKGSALGIVGESGCGKTITGMSILRLLPKNAVVNSGEIIFENQNLFDLKEEDMQKIKGSKIVLIPQDPLTSLNPLWTIGNQLVETIVLHQKVSKKEAEKIAIEALKSVNIPDAEKKMNNYPHQFSGGMKQRVIIAMALSCNPDFIIADEPTTALDVTIQAQVLELIKDIQKKRNSTLMLITHDLGVIADICQEVAIMYAGRVVEKTTTENLFTNPLHPYTKALLDAIPKKNSEKLKNIEGQPPSITEEVVGCPFNLRCPFKTKLCEEIEPVLAMENEKHYVACHLFSKRI